MSREVVLPNGTHVRGVDRDNTLILYDEIFVHDVYFKHDIELHSGACVLDIGANVGLFAVRLNQRLDTAKLYCFEPIPPIFAILQENLRRHNRLDVKAFPFGLSAKTGTATFTYFPGSASESSMYPDESEGTRDARRAYTRKVMAGETSVRLNWLTRWGIRLLLPRVRQRIAGWVPRLKRSRKTTIECPLRRLGEVMAEEQIERVDLLKMDVEGAEFDVLAGLSDEDWLKIHQMVIEVHGGSGAARAHAGIVATAWIPRPRRRRPHPFQPLRLLRPTRKRRRRAFQTGPTSRHARGPW